MSESAGKVWVVDDNAAVASSLVLLLETEGIPSVPMTNAQMVSADLTNGVLPLAMVLDLNMPHNGNTLLQTILETPEWTFPVIIQTGMAERLPPELMGRVMKVVRKPPDPAELVSALRQAMGDIPEEGTE